MIIISSFDYASGIRSDILGFIEEVGTSCTIQIPTVTTDAFGNHVSSSFASSTETLWIRQLNQQLIVEDIGQLGYEDVRFIASYNTALVPDSKITYNGNTYVVLSVDIPDESGLVTHKVGYAKKELT